MVCGEFGVGKVIVGYYFLIVGCENDEDVLFIFFEELNVDFWVNVGMFGFDFFEVLVFDLSLLFEVFFDDEVYMMLLLSEVEGKFMMIELKEVIEEYYFDRVVIDLLS